MSRSQENAARLDSAIDTIIAQRLPADTGDEGELVATARLLRRSLPRLHPSFGFEELLAARLAAARRAEMVPTAAAAAPTPLRPGLEIDRPLPDPGHVGSGERRRRHLVAGGAIASGVSLALPIAGAAIVVWRRTRSSGGMF